MNAIAVSFSNEISKGGLNRKYNEVKSYIKQSPITGNRLSTKTNLNNSKSIVRSTIARDIIELRRVYPSIPISKFKELIKLNKLKYPIEMRR